MTESESAKLARHRLFRCVALDLKYGPTMNAEGQRLVRKAAFSAYLDLRSAGREAEARRIVEGVA